MNTLDAVTAFFGWTAVINIALLFFSTFAVVLAQGPMSRIHARMFALDPAKLPLDYFHYIANFKIIVIVFSVTPYLALKLMT